MKIFILGGHAKISQGGDDWPLVANNLILACPPPCPATGTPIRIYPNLWTALSPPIWHAMPASAILSVIVKSKLFQRCGDVFLRTWDLGFTSFGGPPVHFQILHRRFVNGLGKTPWIDEQTYQELFAVAQAFPGPASTKLAFCIAQVHAGLLPAIFVFMVRAPRAAIRGWERADGRGG